MKPTIRINTLIDILGDRVGYVLYKLHYLSHDQFVASMPTTQLKVILADSLDVEINLGDVSENVPKYAMVQIMVEQGLSDVIIDRALRDIVAHVERDQLLPEFGAYKELCDAIGRRAPADELRKLRNKAYQSLKQRADVEILCGAVFKLSEVIHDRSHIVPDLHEVMQAIGEAYAARQVINYVKQA